MIYIGIDYMVVTMKITKKTIVTIELSDVELLRLETELNMISDHPTFRKTPKTIKLTTDIISAILEE